MSNSDKMQRVNRQKPCPICGKPDWCLVADDDSAAICARIEEGSVKRCGEAGWLHALRNRHNGHYGHRQVARKKQLIKTTVRQKGKPIDFEQLTELYRQQITEDRLESLSQQLGVSLQSLKRLGIGWDGKAYTFGMSNDFGKEIGIHRRFPDGFKASVKGSKMGLFIPSGPTGNGPVLVCEGLSDTAAALDLGFDAIGRPNCNSKNDLMLGFVRVQDVVVVSDNDDVGIKGAEKLAGKLALSCRTVRIISPPAGIKDLRQWLKTGLSASKFKTLIANTEPIRIRIGPIDHNKEAR